MNLAYLFPISASITWGLIYALDQKILKETSPLTLLALDAIITFIVFIPLFITQRSEIRTTLQGDKRALMFIIVVTLLTILADFLILSGVKYLSASTASIIEISYPFFVVLFSFLLFKASPTVPFFIGALLIFIGSAIIVRFNG